MQKGVYKFSLRHGRLVGTGGRFNQVEEEMFGAEGGEEVRQFSPLDVPISLLIHCGRLTVEKLWIGYR